MKVHTYICIIGAGPVGLFAVFQAGLLKMRCHVVDVLPPDESQMTITFLDKQTYNSSDRIGVGTAI